MSNVSKLSTLSLSAMILAGAGSSALAMDFNDKFYGKAQAGIGYSAGFYSGDVKDAIDQAKSAGEKTNKTSHSISASVGFNAFYKATDKINPFVGLNVEGKYAFNNEFVKNHNFQNFLNVNAKLGSSFKVNNDLSVRPYALVGMSVNQYKQKENAYAETGETFNRLYGTDEQNANGKYDAALAYAQHEFMKNPTDNYTALFDIDSVKVYTSNSGFMDSAYNHLRRDGYPQFYTNIENLETGNDGYDLNDFISTLKNLGFAPDYNETMLERYGLTSNLIKFRMNNNINNPCAYAFVDFSNAEYKESVHWNYTDDWHSGNDYTNMSTADVIEYYENSENEDRQTWMTAWLQSQIEQDAPSNVPGLVEPNAQTEEPTTEQNAGTENQQVVEPITPAEEPTTETGDTTTEPVAEPENNTNNENKVRSVSSTKTSYNVGLNVGAGVEFVIKDRFTVGAEYRYTDVKVNGVKFKTHDVGVKFGVQFL